MDKINKHLEKDFEKLFVTKEGFLASRKYKKCSCEYNGYTTYI